MLDRPLETRQILIRAFRPSRLSAATPAPHVGNGKGDALRLLGAICGPFGESCGRPEPPGVTPATRFLARRRRVECAVGRPFQAVLRDSRSQRALTEAPVEAPVEHPVTKTGVEARIEHPAAEARVEAIPKTVEAPVEHPATEAGVEPGHGRPGEARPERAPEARGHHHGPDCRATPYPGNRTVLCSTADKVPGLRCQAARIPFAQASQGDPNRAWEIGPVWS